MLTTLLRLSGFDVAVARKAIDGLILARSFKPQVILLDLSITAPDALVKALKAEVSAEVVLVTGSVNAATVAAAMNVKHVLMKPFEPDDLVRVVIAAAAT